MHLVDQSITSDQAPVQHSQDNGVFTVDDSGTWWSTDMHATCWAIHWARSAGILPMAVLF